MKKITVEHEDGFEAVFEIDEDDTTVQRLHEINNFWGGADDRLEKQHGDIFKTVAILIAIEILKLQARNSFFSSESLCIGKFNEGIEGFPPIDGSHGIRLISTYAFDAYELYFDVSVGED